MVTGSRVERNQYKKRNQKPYKNRWLKRIFIIMIGLGSLLLLAGGGLFTYYAMSAPKISKEDLRGQVSSKIFDREGQLIKSLGGQNRDLMSADEIPSLLSDAVLAIEDARFYKHNGVDPIRILGAAFANLQAGSIQQGGSTITQQLVKLSVFSTDFEDQTLERKAQEAWLSLGIEQEYDKDEILALYLNKLFYSNNVYGAKTAAKTFFGKELSDINLAEAALLAGLPQAPSQYDPYAFPENAKERRDLVLSVMLDRKMINSEEYEAAINTPIEDMLQPLNEDTVSEVDLIIDAYLDNVAQEVQDKMNLNIFTDGLEVYTNIDMNAQKHLYETVHNKHGQIFPNETLQTAVSIIDVDTGQFYALLGGRNQEVAMGLNRASTLNRSVGSTIKPLSAYGPAIEYLNYSTGQLVVDEEYQYTNGDEIYNYDFDYKGKQTIREALSGSRNIPALKMLQKVGLDKAYSFLQKMDINIMNNDQRELVESNAIGGEMTPIQLSAAYATIANYGVYQQPYTVNKVVTQAGTVQEFKAEERQAMKDSTAYMLIDILKGVPGDFAEAADIEGLHHAGKTGTTNYTKDQLAQLGLDSSTYAAPDGWYAGISPQFAITSWVGYDNPLEAGNYLSLEETRIPQEIYQEMMSFLMKDIPKTDWNMPDSVEQVEIEKYTDPIKKPSASTPKDLRSKELFIKGSQPSQVSDNYRTIEAPKGFDASYDQVIQEIISNWQALPESSTAHFELTLNGTLIYSGKDTSYRVSAPAPGYYELGLKIVDGSVSSDTLIITFDLSTEANESSTTSTDTTTSSEESTTTSSDDPASSTTIEPIESTIPQTTVEGLLNN